MKFNFDNVGKYFELVLILCCVVLFALFSVLLFKYKHFSLNQCFNIIVAYIILQSMIIYRVYFQKE